MESVEELQAQGRVLRESGGSLGLSDTCDATASGTESAQVRVLRTSTYQVLDFCGHHFAAAELALILGGWVIAHDARQNIQPQPPQPVIGGNYGSPDSHGLDYR